MRGVGDTHLMGPLYEHTLVDRGLKLKDRIHDAIAHQQNFEFKRVADELNALLDDFGDYLYEVDRLDERFNELQEPPKMLANEADPLGFEFDTGKQEWKPRKVTKKKPKKRKRS